MRLDKLIEKLCPDGVKYMKIEEICNDICSGGTPQSGISEYYGGNIPWLRTQEINFNDIYNTEIKITELGLKNSSVKYIPKNCVIIAMYGATVGRVAINKIPLTTNQACCNLEINRDIALYKYVFYCLSNQYSYIKSLGQGSQTNINSKIVKQLTIPIPPLEVQEKIVRILDNFTELTSELTSELTAELTARQKQYSYYRDYLLSFDNEQGLADDMESVDIKTAKRVKLEDICEVYDGTHQTPNYTDSGVKFVSVENIKDLYGTKKFISETDFEKYKIKPQINDVLMTRIGDIGTPAIVNSNEPLAYYVSLALLRPNTNVITTEFLYHSISSKAFRKELNKHTIHTAVPIKINKNDIGKCFINVPSIEIQNKIVSILNRFDNLCNGISEGLPAEIEARKKQYEYYRDALLSFDEKLCSQIVKVERERELSRSKAIKWRELKDILTIKNGKDYKSYGEGNIPVYGSGGIMTYIDTYAYNKPSVLIPRKGSIDKLYYVDVPFWTVDTIFYTEINTDIVLAKYVYYWLKKEHLEKLNTAGGVPSLTQAVLNKVKIAIPPIEEQKRIVSILDRFDKLCNDISEGLPAEIEARKKQYEYYRDKLLTFKEVL